MLWLVLSGPSGVEILKQPCTSFWPVAYLWHTFFKEVHNFPVPSEHIRLCDLQKMQESLRVRRKFTQREFPAEVAGWLINQSYNWVSDSALWLQNVLWADESIRLWWVTSDEAPVLKSAHTEQVCSKTLAANESSRFEVILPGRMQHDRRFTKRPTNLKLLAEIATTPSNANTRKRLQISYLSPSQESTHKNCVSQGNFLQPRVRSRFLVAWQVVPAPAQYSKPPK